MGSQRKIVFEKRGRGPYNNVVGHRRIARWIASKRREGLTVDMAIALAKEEFSLEQEALGKIWKDHRGAIRSGDRSPPRGVRN